MIYANSFKEVKNLASIGHKEADTELRIDSCIYSLTGHGHELLTLTLNLRQMRDERKDTAQRKKKGDYYLRILYIVMYNI